MRKLIYIFPILILFFLSIIYVLSILETQLDLEGKLIIIEKGANASQIADILFENGVIKNRTVFYYYIALNDHAKELDFGNYFFDGKFSMLEVLEKIKEGKVRLRKITIPEGLTNNKVCRIFSRNGFGDYDILLGLVSDSSYAMELTGFSIPDLEGFLYPETYHFPDNVNEKYIIEHLVKTFFNQTAEMNFEPNENLDFYETIILASIVEREAKINNEKPKIASVYLNRLELNYKLQADPTVAFALEQVGRNRKKLYYKDLEIDSPYNTYRNYGLPPTPICSPSISSIEAVLNPEETELLFFFADGSGGHEFSLNYREHLRKLAEMRNNGR